MNRIPGFARWGLVLSLAVLAPTSVLAMCWPCPCVDCEIQSRGQLNWVNMDRENGTIQLIPNIRITGAAEDFALIVPTPAVPEIAPAAVEIWDEALAFTAPIRTLRQNNGGCGGIFSTNLDSRALIGSEDGVVIVGQTTVGGFIATTIRSDDATALVTWLNQNNYQVKPEDTEKFAPYAEAGWVFTAMRLDTDNVVVPPSWDTNVDPVVFTYDATEFEVPLPVLSINRAPTLPMVFFIVDDGRAELSGFNVVYANRISGEEYAAIEDRHPNLAPFLAPGKFVTRLDRDFLSEDPMTESIFLKPSANQQEFRRILWSSVWESFPAMVLALMVMFLMRPAVGFVRGRRHM